MVDKTQKTYFDKIDEKHIFSGEAGTVWEDSKININLCK